MWEAILTGRTMAVSNPPTFTELDPFHWTRIQIEENLEPPHYATVQFGARQIPDSVKPYLRDPISNPSELRIYDGTGTMRFAGQPTRFGINGATGTLRARSLEGLLWFMLVEADYSDSADVFAHVIALIDAYQALDSADYGIDTAATDTTLPRVHQLTILRDEARKIGDEVQRLARASDGFNWYIDPATRDLVLVPSRGSDLSASVFVDTRSIVNGSIGWTVNEKTFASEGRVFSRNTFLMGEHSNTAVRNNHGRVYATDQRHDITHQATIDAHAEQLVDEREGVTWDIEPVLLPVRELEEDSFEVGDTISFDWDPGIGPIELSPRVSTKRTLITRESGLHIDVGFKPEVTVARQVAELDTRLSRLWAVAAKGVDVWHFVGQTGEPAFSNDWENESTAGWRGLRFRRNADGTIQIEGNIQTTVSQGTGANEIFVLTAGYRPKEHLRPSASYFIGTTVYNTTLSILNNGSVQISLHTGGVISSAGISTRFEADPATTP